MKLVEFLRRLISCFSTKSPGATAIASTAAAIKTRLSYSIADVFRDHQEPQEDEEEDSLIDAASSSQHPSLPPSRSVIVGTIYGHRKGGVSFCVQQDPSIPPPFLFELSIPTQLLAKEMQSGLLRIALECRRAPSSSGQLRSTHAWKTYCNGRRVGYAVKRLPTEKDRRVLETVRTMSGSTGMLPAGEVDGGRDEGDIIYMRSSYERVVGSRDSVSYHLINPGGSPGQELSVFLLRTG